MYSCVHASEWQWPMSVQTRSALYPGSDTQLQSPKWWWMACVVHWAMRRGASATKGRACSYLLYIYCSDCKRHKKLDGATLIPLHLDYVTLAMPSCNPTTFDDHPLNSAIVFSKHSTFSAENQLSTAVLHLIGAQHSCAMLTKRHEVDYTLGYRYKKLAILEL